MQTLPAVMSSLGQTDRNRRTATWAFMEIGFCVRSLRRRRRQKVLLRFADNSSASPPLKLSSSQTVSFSLGVQYLPPKVPSLMRSAFITGTD